MRILNYSLLYLITGLCWWTSGCKSPNTVASPFLISVRIEGAEVKEIENVILEVFQQHGYKVKSFKMQQYVFEKSGTMMNTAAYGGWEGSAVWMRAKVTIEHRLQETHLVHCDGFVVTHYGDPFLESEQRLSKIRKGPYAKILKEIKGHFDNSH